MPENRRNLGAAFPTVHLVAELNRIAERTPLQFARAFAAKQASLGSAGGKAFTRLLVNYFLSLATQQN